MWHFCFVRYFSRTWPLTVLGLARFHGEQNYTNHIYTTQSNRPELIEIQCTRDMISEWHSQNIVRFGIEHENWKLSTYSSGAIIIPDVLIPIIIQFCSRFVQMSFFFVVWLLVLVVFFKCLPLSGVYSSLLWLAKCSFFFQLW